LELRCEECGSTALVWDYKGGCIVCSACGAVLDSIVVSPSGVGEDASRAAPLRASERRWLREKARTYSAYKRLRARLGVGGCELFVDSKAFEEYLAGRRGRVYLLVSDSSLKARKIAEESREVRELIEVLAKKFPRLYSRTERARVAIALILLHLRSRERLNASTLGEISKRTGVSESHVKRLYSMLLKVRSEIATCSAP